MRVLWPQPEKDWNSWARQLIRVLTDSFNLVPELQPGLCFLWKSGVTIPDGYLQCDNSEYPSTLSPPLVRLYGESSPGNFRVPNITAPAGSIVIVKT